jgi:hypothetical protein
MDHEANKPVVEHLPKLANHLRVEDLWALETYFRDRGGSEFRYDGDLDVFRFPEDGRFAFCDEFANWKLLRERGYLDV